MPENVDGIDGPDASHDGVPVPLQQPLRQDGDENVEDREEEEPVIKKPPEDPLLRVIDEVVSRAYPLAPRSRARDAWEPTGKRLWTNTTVRPMTLQDMPEIERTYGNIVVVDGHIIALRRRMLEEAMLEDEIDMRREHAKTIADSDVLLRKGGGYLNHFRVRPIARPAEGRTVPMKDAWVTVESVCEQMTRQLREAIEGPSVVKGVQQSIYEGAVLVPNSAPDKVLAWATWTRSRNPDMASRTEDNDAAVREVADTYRSMSLLGGWDLDRFVEKANQTLLFDTIYGRAGSASVLWSQLISPTADLPGWRNLGYRRVILYRHNAMQVLLPGEQIGQYGNVDGTNDASDRFFKDRGMRYIGDCLSPFYALRTVKEEADKKTDYLVLSNFGWMWEAFERIEAESKARDAEERKRFDK